MSETAYLGIKGHVVAFDVQTGREHWRKFVRSTTITNVVPCGEVILVYAKGHLYGLRKEDGALLWENQLDRLGYGYGIIGTDGGQVTTIASAIAQQQAAAASGS